MADKNNPPSKSVLRRKAEELLQKRAIVEIENYSDAEILNLINELEIHKIELEAQNDALNSLVHKAEIEAEKYTNLYDFAPCGYFTITKKEEILETNFSGAALLGKERSQLLNKRFCYFIADKSKPTFFEFLEKIFESKTSQTCEIVLSGRSKIATHVFLTGIVNEGSDQCLLTMVDITQLNKIENSLQKSQEKLEGIFNVANSGIFLLDSFGNFLMFNDWFCKSLGYTRNEFQELNVKAVSHPEDLEKSMALNQKIINCEIEKYQIEKRYIRKDKSTLWCEVSASAIKDQNDNVVNIIKVIYDITARKQAEQELINEKRRLALILIGTGAGTWEWNIHSGSITINERWSALIGYTLEELAPVTIDTWRKYTHPDDAKYSEANLEKHLEGAVDYCESEFRMKHKNGNWIWILSRGAINERDLNGEPLFMSGTHLDITERKEAEKLIVQSETRFSSILNSSPVAMALNDENLNITYLNQAFYDMFGYTIAEIPTVHEWFPKAFPNLEYRKKISNSWLTALETVKQTGADFAPMEVLIRCKDGSDKTIMVSATKLFNSNGSEYLVNFYDITARKQAEQALEQEKRRLALILIGTGAGTWEWNIQTGETIFNEQWAAIIGYTIEELSPISIETWKKFTHPDDVKRTEEILEKYFEGNLDYYECEFRMKHKNGDWVWILDRGSVNEWDIDGKPLLMSGTHLDITERKEAEKLIVQSKTRFSSIINCSPVAMALNDENLNITYLNQAFYGMFGYTIAEIPTVHEWFPKAFPNLEYRKKISKSWITALETVKQTGADFAPMEVLIRCKDGSDKTIMVSATRLFNSNDTEYLVNFYDITAQKQAEQALIAEKRRLALILIGTGAGTWEWTVQSGIMVINERYAELIGYTIKELEPISFDTWRRYTHPDDAKLTEKIIENYFQGALDYYESEFRMKHKNGDWVWILSRGKINKRDLNGEPLSMSGTHLDITERKHSEEKLKLTSEKFQELVNSTGGIVWEADAHTYNFTYVSDQAVRLLGYAVEEWHADGFWANHLHQEDKQNVIDYCVSHTEKLEAHDFTYRFVAKNGEIVWLRDIVNVVAEDGKPRWLRGVMFDVTQLKETNLLLGESEEKYRGLVENAPYGIIIYVEDKIAFINAEVIKMARAKDKNELVGRSVLDFVHPDSMEDIVRRMAEVHRDANASEIVEAKLMTIGGIPLYVGLKAIPTVFEHKQAVQLIIQDISLQKQAAVDLSKINRVYALISHINNLIIRVHNRDELFQEICNIAVCFGKFRMSWIGFLNDDNTISTAAFAGFENGYFAGRDLTSFRDVQEKRGTTRIGLSEGRAIICNDIAHDPIMEPFRNEALQRGYYSMISIPILVRDKNIAAFNLYSDEKNFFSSEEEISLLEKISLNIAFALESILIEEERKQNEQKIRQLSQAVEQSPVTVLITNTEGKIEYVNPKFVETTGYTLEEVLGKNPRFLKSGHTTGEEYKKLWTNLGIGQTWHGEFYNKKKDGTLYWESATISPILNAQGKATHFIGIKEDITERKIAEQELIDAKLKAEESDRLKLAFLANMSHEIRTPMNGILGFTELLKAPNLSGTEQNEFISIIEKSGQRMLNIINDIINISKVEAGQVEVTLSETNVNEQLSYIYSFFTPEANQKGIHLVIKKQLSPKYNLLLTDNEKLYAVLTNLVKNAIKFTNEGSIEFGCEKKGVFLEFFVKDSGIGISDSQKGIVFERFRQASESVSRSHEGSGLGLAISKAYIEKLGGKIWVDSEKGKGSTFYFTIPLQSESENNLEHDCEETIKTEKENLEMQEENKIKGLKVLIVEDDPISKLLLTFVIKSFSKEIIKVSSGIEAIEACNSNPDIDLVMMDVNMPEMGGYEATRLIREFNKDVVIIAQTANALQSDRNDAIEAGCTDYISKPINSAELKTMIQKYFYK
jgi:PAS domain S-box-containing protein